MCGIFGFIGTDSIHLKKCTSIIEHRGPDAEGFLWYNPKSSQTGKTPDVEWNTDNNFKIAFGFRRLAIIDLVETSNQPLFSSDNRFAIIFNGEIYNYIELRKELEQLGHVFYTHSDTEVIIEAYRAFGADCVNKFNGMWGFAILDFKENIIFCSRDRFGVKPFYYNKSNSNLIFASEIKQFWGAGVKREINENIIGDFLERSVINHTEETLFKGILQLLPGHNLFINFNENEIISYEIKKYWKLQENPALAISKFEVAQKKYLSLLNDSINLRFRSDVPVGACLSGGLDSSTIVSLASESQDKSIITFSSVFEKNPKFDEKEFMDMVFEKYKTIKPYFCSTSSNQIINELDNLIWHQDEPFPTFSILAQWNVMKLAKENGVVVLLDGQGGDEFLGGYRKYYAFYLKECLQKGNFGKFFSGIYYLLKNTEFDFFNSEGWGRYLGWKTSVDVLSRKGKELNKSAKIGLKSAKTLKDKFIDDIEKFSIPPLLRYEDRNSMAFSIESRVPFLDYKLANFIISQPTEHIISKGYTKYILREATKGILPEKIRLRINKLGFATPQSEWMSEPEINQYFKSYFLQMNNPYLNNQAIYEDFLLYPNSKLDSFNFSKYLIFDRWYHLNFVDKDFLDSKING
ncbi:MAG: asparagine synthase (glutamine-hydrolyzing) [Bacteroidetes bacterium B1(2017)]|nr:MAG: asparagine synthase (glutamine-hydrolyzing) [Bacteroidetes bacterium B1(2017)]